MLPEVQHQQLLAEAARVGWPEHYRDDLFVYDKVALAKYTPTEFGWVLRRCGTDFYFPNDEASFNWAQANFSLDPTVRPYWFSDGRLQPMTHAEFLAKVKPEVKNANARFYSRY